MCDMSEKLNILVNLSESAGLKINVSKTKLMKIWKSNENLQIYGTQVEEVDIFQYLGSQITKDGGAQMDVKSRIQKRQAKLLECSATIGNLHKYPKTYPMKQFGVSLECQKSNM